MILYVIIKFLFIYFIPVLVYCKCFNTDKPFFTWGTSIDTIETECREKILEPLKPTTKPCTYEKVQQSNTDNIMHEGVHIVCVHNYAYQMSLLMNWEIADFDAEHASSTKAQHVLKAKCH